MVACLLSNFVDSSKGGLSLREAKNYTSLNYWIIYITKEHKKPTKEDWQLKGVQLVILTISHFSYASQKNISDPPKKTKIICRNTNGQPTLGKFIFSYWFRERIHKILHEIELLNFYLIIAHHSLDKIKFHINIFSMSKKCMFFFKLRTLELPQLILVVLFIKSIYKLNLCNKPFLYMYL